MTFRAQIWLAFVLLMSSFSAQATHNRAGEILYRHLGLASPSYEITIVTYSEAGSPADRDSLELEILNCGSSQTLTSFYIARTAVIPLDGGIQRNEYRRGIYTFPGFGCYVLTMTDPNRINGIRNMSGSVNVPFYIEDTLTITDPQFIGFNSSPVLLQPPLALAQTLQVFTYNSGAYDPDGDSLSFQLVPPRQAPGTDVPAYTFPDNPLHQAVAQNTLSIDSETGDLRWDVAQAEGIYNIAILVREFRNGQQIGTLIRDMQIIVEDHNNEPPALDDIRDTCILAGEFLQLEVIGRDPDPGQVITLTATGGPFGEATNPATFTTTPSTSVTSGVFAWQTDCSHIRSGYRYVYFKAADDYTHGDHPAPLSDYHTWRLQVVAPPITGLTAQSSGTQILLSWDANYLCGQTANFLGYTVWRREQCDSLPVDTCLTGASLANLGYIKISGAQPLTTTSFVDPNAVVGLRYAYRVVPEFAQRSPAGYPYNAVSGLPSDPACAELKKDVPILTHVDILQTDAAAGELRLKWVAPIADDLDTMANPPPYRLDIYHHDGIGASGAATLVSSLARNTFASLAEDSLQYILNTRDMGHSYRIDFHATNTQGDFYLVGSSPIASSIWLSATTGGAFLDLSWVEEVPWTNTWYTVFRETAPGSGIFDSIAQVSEPYYRDTAVTIGDTFCYRVRSFGGYGNPPLPDALLNHSQILCSVPLDTTAPCTPVLSVAHACSRSELLQQSSDFENHLTWTSDPDCAGDAVRFHVYYQSEADEDWQLLAELDDPNAREYIHANLQNLAGCYSIAAVDSFGNESGPSVPICNDNCPRYQLPNTFTPNGDGSNDIFRPFHPYYFVDRIQMKVFNGNGALVFETTDPAIQWDGTHFDGRELPEGTYYYVCVVYERRLDGITERPELLEGFIHLFRGS